MNMTPWQLPMNPSQFPSRDPIALSADLDLRIIEDRFVFWDRITVLNEHGEHFLLLSPHTCHYLTGTDLLGRNRPRHPHSVSAYTRRIIRNLWVQGGGGPMGMDEEARLTQGFGRMQAVMRARKPIITSWRRRPLTKAEIAIFDQVTGLTPKDRLSMYLRMPSQMNVSKFNQVLQVIRDHFYGEVTRGYGESEALELLADHHYAAWEAAWPVVVSGQSKTPFRQVGALAAITYLDAHYRALGDPFSSQKVVQTWIDMSANLGLLPHTPAHTMHGRITGSYSRKTSRAFHLNLMRRLLHGFSALFAHRNLRRLTPQGTILDPTLRTKVIEADL